MPKGPFPFAPMRFWLITAVSLLMVMRALVPTGYIQGVAFDDTPGRPLTHEVSLPGSPPGGTGFATARCCP